MTSNPVVVRVFNNLLVPVTLYTVAGDELTPAGVILAGQSGPAPDKTTGVQYSLRNALSGAFVAEFAVAAAWSYAITPSLLRRPNSMSPMDGNPIPATGVPPSSPSYLVGCGTWKNPVSGAQLIVTREQFWRLHGDSTVLTPGARRTITRESSTGLTTTSSTAASVEATMGLSGSGGWSVVSAAISSSLSASAAVFQQTQISTTRTSSFKSVLENDSPVSQEFFFWQLMDVVTVYSSAYKPQNQTISGLAPLLATRSPLGGGGSNATKGGTP